MKLALKFSSGAGELADMRAKTRSFLDKAGLDEMEIECFVLALDEACTNVIRHAYSGSDDRTIRMQLSVIDGTLRCIIRDYGKSCDPSKIRGRELTDFRPGGLGVCIIANAFDTVDYHPMPKGTRLTLTKRISPKAGTR